MESIVKDTPVVQLAKKLSASFRSYAEQLPKGSMRDYQGPLYYRILDKLDSGYTEGLVKAAGGSGKTYLIGCKLHGFLQRKDMDYETLGGKQAIVVLYRNEDARGIYLQLTDDKEGVIQLPKDRVSLYRSDMKANQKDRALTSDIIVTNLHSMHSLARHGFIDHKNTPLIILDEGHHFTGPRTKALLRHFLGKSLVLTYTATDTFASGETISGRLFNNAPPLATFPYIEAVDKEAIVPTKNILVDPHVSLGKIKVTNGEYNQSELKDANQKKGFLRDYAALRMMQTYVDDETGIKFANEKAFVFATDITHAKRLERMANLCSERAKLHVSIAILLLKRWMLRCTT